MPRISQGHGRRGPWGGSASQVPAQVAPDQRVRDCEPNLAWRVLLGKVFAKCGQGTARNAARLEGFVIRDFWGEGCGTQGQPGCNSVRESG